jgi:hypothetical protein
VHARLDLHHDRVWLEILLAASAVAFVAWILLLTGPSDWAERGVEPYLLFAGAMGIGAWLPLLARRRWSAVGELSCEGDVLVLRGARRTRRIPLRRIRGVSVAPGVQGASVVMALEGGVLAAALDDIEDARRLAGEIDGPMAGEGVVIPVVRFGAAGPVLRVGTTLFSLGFYHVRAPDHGLAELFGQAAIVCGLALLAFHLLSHRRVPLGCAVSTWSCSRAWRAHLSTHAVASRATEPEPPPRLRLGEPGEPLGEWLARTRRQLADPDAYRSAAQAIRPRLEQALANEGVPLRERALALRILSASEPGEVRRRIAEAPALDAEDRAWIEAVALAEDDGAALARIARRAPDFLA